MKRWIISTNSPDIIGPVENNIAYYVWINDTMCSSNSGYYWTGEEFVVCYMNNDTPEHPFTFSSKDEAERYLKSRDISQRCNVIEIDIERAKHLNILEDLKSDIYINGKIRVDCYNVYPTLLPTERKRIEALLQLMNIYSYTFRIELLTEKEQIEQIDEFEKYIRNH